MRRSAPQTWFRTGGPAEVLFRPADAADLAAFLRRCRRRAGDGAGCRLEPAGARRRHEGRGDPPDARLHGHRRRGQRACGGRRRARSQRGADRARSCAGRAGVPERHPGHDRRCGGDECRRLWRRARRGAGLGRSRRPCRQGPHACRRPSSASAIATARRRPTGSSPRRGCAPSPATSSPSPRRIAEIDSARARDPAAQPHRRLDLRQSARPQGVGADRPGRLPRPARSARRRSPRSIATS